MGRFTRAIDWLTFLLILCLSGISLFLLLSINQSFFIQQCLYLAVGIVLLIVLSQLDEIILWWFAPMAYVIGLLFLMISYFGPSIRGATRWITLFGFQIQPSELVKPLMLLAFSYFMTRFPPRNIRNIPIHGVLFFIPFLLVFKQPDLGSSIVYSASWLGMMVAAGMPVMVVLVMGGFFGLLGPILWHVLVPYQKTRILTFLNPALDPKGGGYHAIQAMIAVGSGQLMGRGLGHGTQSQLRFLPEHHTDFIFATLIESLGFFGGFILFLCYLFLLFRIVWPFFKREDTDLFSFIYAFGLLSLLLSQIVVHAGMNMGILPITGITLPFVSYGGSSLMSLGIGFGFLWSLRRSKISDPVVAFNA